MVQTKKDADKLLKTEFTYFVAVAIGYGFFCPSLAMLKEFVMATRKCCTINLEYLPIKAHYFFMFGGMGSTIPFMQVLAKDLGISATAVGIVYTIVPFCIFFSKPIFGYITDVFRNIKLTAMLLTAITAIALFAVIFVPPIENNLKGNFQVTAHCTDTRDQLIIEPSSYNPTCFKEMRNRQFKCEFISSNCLPKNHFFGVLNVSNFIPNKVNASFVFTFTLKVNYSCDCIKSNYSDLSCEMNISECYSHQKVVSQYRTYNLWLYALLAVIAYSGSATVCCLSDAACYEVLGDTNSKLYGHQRAWATISWGISTFLVGYLNDIATKYAGHNTYYPGFYLMLAFVGVDLVILYRLQLTKANISTSVCKDVGKIYKSPQTILFSFGVYIIGALSGLVWNYQFWYLTDLGASKTLLGLVVAVQCLLTEVPFFFFSEWFIVKFGHFYCLIGSLAAFALRTGLYVILKNPWMTLPVELLHGVTFAIFYTAMTMYCNDFAPPGTEATMLGVLGGLFEGLGVATGSLLGGIGFDKIGGQDTFFVASMMSLASVLFFTIAFNTIKPKSANIEPAKSSQNASTNYGLVN